MRAVGEVSRGDIYGRGNDVMRSRLSPTKYRMRAKRLDNTTSTLRRVRSMPVIKRRRVISFCKRWFFRVFFHKKELMYCWIDQWHLDEYSVEVLKMLHWRWCLSGYHHGSRVAHRKFLKFFSFLIVLKFSLFFIKKKCFFLFL